MEAKSYIKELIERSKKAQKEFESFTQEQVDAIVRDIARVVYDNAEELAKMAVEETRMGVYEHKVKKNQGKASIIWHSLKGKKSVGIIGKEKDTGIVKVAKPKGVVGAVTPCTNPIVTPMCNIMFALKGLNSVIVAPHPRSKKCGKKTIDLMLERIAKYNVPENLIQIIDEPSIELTNELMRAVDVVVATGGMGMVKAAYSSGKPAFGVGQGNVQCIIDKNEDMKEIVPKIIYGRTFDNGIICSGEQTIIVHEDEYDAYIEEFKANKAYFVNDDAGKNALREALFPNGVMNKDLVGQSIQAIAEAAGLDIPKDIAVILVEADDIGDKDILSKEKMCPVISTYKYQTFEEAVNIAKTNLLYEGSGHSASIHSNNDSNIEYAGIKLPVSRLVVNQPSSVTLGGSFNNGFAPTTTLGCGSWGNNSISENLDYIHLINISRIGYYMADNKVPTQEELWG